MSISTNKQAYHDYQVLETLEAGLVLSGPEVKAVKSGQINLKGSYISVPNDSEVLLKNAHIPAYKPAFSAQLHYDPTAERKLLLHKKQIKHLLGKSKESGIALIPLKVYLHHRLVKLELGICRGKKKYDKREDKKKKDFARRKRQLMNE